MREGDVILVASKCHNDSYVQYYAYNAKNLPPYGITVNDAGNRFKVSKSNRAVCKTYMYSIDEAVERKKLTFSGTAFLCTISYAL